MIITEWSTGNSLLILIKNNSSLKIHPPPEKKQNRKETVQLLYMKRLIYLKKWTIVRPSCFAPKAVVTRFRWSCRSWFQNKEKKGIWRWFFFKTILIQLPCNPFKYICVHMRKKKTFKVLSFVWCKNIVCYDIALQDTMTKRAKKNIKENCFKSVKALKVIAILTAYLWFSL
jgi:hypothetical protein